MAPFTAFEYLTRHHASLLGAVQRVKDVLRQSCSRIREAREASTVYSTFHATSLTIVT